MMLSQLLDMLADGTVIIGGWIVIFWLINNWNMKNDLIRRN